MYNIIMQIIAWFIVACCLVTFAIYIWLYIKNKKDRSDWLTLNRDTYITDTDFFRWYLIPTISIGVYSNYFEINIIFLRWFIAIEYHIKNDAEEEAASNARYESKKK